MVPGEPSRRVMGRGEMPGGRVDSAGVVGQRWIGADAGSSIIAGIAGVSVLKCSGVARRSVL